MKRKLNSILNRNKSSFKINYEKLKIYLGYEDYFYENVLEPACNKAGFSIEFDKEFVVLRKKEN